MEIVLEAVYVANKHLWNVCQGRSDQISFAQDITFIIFENRVSENSKRVLLANIFSMIYVLYREQTDPYCVNFYQLVTITIVNNQWQYWQIDDMIVGLQFTKKRKEGQLYI